MTDRFANSQVLHWVSYLALVPLSLYVILTKKIFFNKPKKESNKPKQP